MNIIELATLWDDLAEAIQRVECSIPQNMTKNVETMSDLRKRFAAAMNDFGRSEEGNAAWKTALERPAPAKGESR